MKLSILIPTLYERIDKLCELKASLLGQILSNNASEDVEVLELIDNREKTTGAKRNILLDMAKGDYIAFIDDDDQISPDYIKLVLEAIKTSPDVVGMRLVQYTDGKFYGDTCHSIIYKEWKNIPNGNTWLFERCPNHLNPVKREYAVKARFPDKVLGEDKDYSYKLRKYLKSEVMIETPIYYYWFVTK
jgi:glycosyltransferase involved in cell wall biosynthesis